MPAKPWANNAQLDFLKNRRVVFATHQSAKTVSKFWSEIYRDFFEKWPDASAERENLTEKERAMLSSTADWTEEQWVVHRKKAIYNWYNNNSLGKKKRGTKGIKITIPQSSSRLSTEAHLYSKRYYETRVKPLVEAEIGDKKLDRKARIAIVNKHLTECFKSESAEVKEEIRRAREEERTAKETAQGLDSAVVKAVNELTIDEILIAQSAMPDVLADFCEEIGRRSGWSFALMGGGPDAANNGEITTISVHTGQDKYGQTFRRAYKDYKSAVEIPFSNHLNSVYPKSVRDKFKSAGAGPSSGSSTGIPPSSPVPTTSPSVSGTSEQGVPSGSAATAPAVSSAPAAPATTAPAISSAPAAPATTAPAIASAPAVSPPSAPAAVASTDGVPNSPAAPAATAPVIASAPAPTTAAAPASIATTRGVLANPDAPAPGASTVVTIPIAASVATSAAAATAVVSAIGADPVPTSPAAPAVASTAAPAVASTAAPAVASTAAPTSTGAPAAVTTAHAAPFILPPSSAFSSPIPLGFNIALQNPMGELGMNIVGNAGGKENIGGFEFSNATKGAGLGFYPGNNSVLQPSLTDNQYGTHQSYQFGYDFTTGQSMPQNNLNLHSMETVDWDVLDAYLDQYNQNQGNLWAGSVQGGVWNQNFNGYTNQMQAPKMNMLWPAANDGIQIDQSALPDAVSDAPSLPSGASEITPPSTSLLTPRKEDNNTQTSLSGIGEPAVSDALPVLGVGRRNRKPPMPKEVIPLVEQQAKKPEWIVSTHEYLKNDIDSGLWNDLIQKWFTFETDSGLLETPSQRLPTKNRPALLSKWLGNRRQFNQIPKIDDVAAFGVEWMTWWNAIQPKWRQSSTPGTLPQPVSIAKGSEDLSSIRKAGPVGLVVAIVSLKWWAGDGQNVEWLKAVEDVKALLEKMTASTSTNLKRKMGPEEEVSDKRKKV